MTDDTKRQGGELVVLELLDRPLGQFCANDLFIIKTHIQALQQLCGGLQTRGDTLQALSNEQQDDLRRAGYRIVALEGALRIAHEGFAKLDSEEIEPGHPGICDAIEMIAGLLAPGGDEGERAQRLAKHMPSREKLRKMIEAQPDDMPEPLAGAPGGDGGEGQDPLDDLVSRFSAALLEKLKAAREKYEFGGEPWLDNDWHNDLLWMVRKHLEKGDPRDVAAYCAFAWHHGWSLSHPTEPDRPETCDVCDRPADWTEICTDPLCPNEKVRASEPDQPEGKCICGWDPEYETILMNGECPIHGTPQGKEGE